MARNVREKLANGEKLDDRDVQYAVERGIELPEEYGQKAASVQHEMGGNFGQPPVPVVDGGSYPQPNDQGPGLFLTEDQLSSLTNDVLRDIAEAAGVEVSGRKSSIIAQLSGGVDSGSEDDEE
jgi:hypothetical protein